MKIENRHQYYLAMAEIENYLQKGFSNLTEQEDEQLAVLSRAAEAWEIKEYPMPMQPTLKDILNHIMFVRDINQTELSDILQISKGALSEMLKGSKKPNLEVAKQLHMQFHIDGNLLLESL
jgi:antitoxin component HigA of HigAB toxin-antitoxin module